MSAINQLYQDPDLLIRQFRSGNPRALEFLYELHYKTLWNYARRLTTEDARSEEIAMDAFLKIWERRSDFHDLKKLTAYLFTITRNASLNHLRQEKRKRSADQALAFLAERATQDPDAELIRAELIQLAFLQAEAFPKQMKKAFMLIFREGLSLPEVAEEMGVSVATVKTHKAFALKSLRQLFARQTFSLLHLLFF